MVVVGGGGGGGGLGCMHTESTDQTTFGCAGDVNSESSHFSHSGTMAVGSKF